MTELRYTVPLNPVSKKNSQRIAHNNGRLLILPSKAYKDYEAAAMWYLKPRPAEPVRERCNVKCTFYMATRRRVDLVNLQEAALDVLVAAGILADDNKDIVAAMDGSRVRYDKNAPRTEITITPLGE